MGCCGKTITKAKRIAIGWTNLARGKTNDQVKARLRICRNCGSNRWMGIRGICAKCKCPIQAKVRVPDEKCDLDKWPQMAENGK